jgi:hypothetical protein
MLAQTAKVLVYVLFSKINPVGGDFPHQLRRENLNREKSIRGEWE